MKIKRFKKKCIILSLIFIMTGALISIAGFGVIGFNYNRLKENVTDDAWYQTIHISNDKLWYGIEINNNIRIMSIGDVE